ncbi:uncharacterized protein VTP21DRAFT_2586 [Calcarisporiella thermophila]|uniref:uncharacterized protein n=1 Tax=Calcarisporiella thermophila TaxID=911321 RepID=UPI0037424836
MSPAERNYTTHEKELLAIVEALREWRVYLHGKHFKIYTDHAPLRYLNTQPTLTGRQARWMQTLESYDYEIIYQPGKSNVVADALSRRPDLTISAISTLQPPEEFLTEIKSKYTNDLIFNDLVKHLGDPDLPVPRELNHLIKYYELRDGLLYYGDEKEEKNRLCIPEDPGIRTKLLQENHDLAIAGHLGVERTYERMQRNFYWPRMIERVKKYIRSCDTCQRTKANNRAPIGLLQPLSTPSQRWQQISMDLITHLPKSKRGHDAIIVFVDRLSKMAHFVATNTTANAATIAKIFFEVIFRLHGIPQTIISDRDPRFISNFWKSVHQLLGTKLALSSAYHPESDGQTERTNRTLEQMLRAYASYHQNDWDEHLVAAEFAYNNSKQSSTQMTPFELNYGQHPLAPTSLLNMTQNQINVPAAEEFLLRMSNLIKIASDNLTTAKATQAQYANQSRREEEFNVGDKVMLSTANINLVNQARQATKKLSHKYIGPYEITEKISPVAYLNNAQELVTEYEEQANKEGEHS